MLHFLECYQTGCSHGVLSAAHPLVQDSIFCQLVGQRRSGVSLLFYPICFTIVYF